MSSSSLPREPQDGLTIPEAKLERPKTAEKYSYSAPTSNLEGLKSEGDDTSSISASNSEAHKINENDSYVMSASILEGQKPKEPDTQSTLESNLQQRKTAENDTYSNHASLVQSHIQKPQSLIREILFVTILTLSQFMNQAGLGMTLAPLSIIGRTWGIEHSGGQLSWLIAAYSLTAGTFILIAGRLGDLFGHKMLFTAGWLWFGLWSLLAGFSVFSTARFFDCTRAFQGIGPAFLLPNALAILGRTYEPGRRKEMIFAFFGASAPVGFLVGSVFSSLIAQDLWWPWAFWIAAIVCFILAILGFFIIPHTPPPTFPNDGISIWERIDFAGSLVGVSGLVLFNFAWNQGPVAGWTDVYVYVILIIGSLVIGLFFFVESRARFPLLPFDALNRSTGFVLACIATGWSSFSIWLFYSFQFLEHLRKQSPLHASAAYIPCSISGLAAAMTTGYLLSRIPASFIMMISLTAFTVGSILLATAPVHQTYWAQTFLCIVIMPWGM